MFTVTFLHSLLAPPTRTQITAKYSYKANPSSPLVNELSVSQKESLVYIQDHPDNAQWWLVENAAGDIGYVPGNYMMVLSDAASNFGGV